MKLGSALILSLLFVESLTQIIKAPDGPIQGTISATTTGKTYYSYYSIPFAKPPVGSRRFKAPEQIDPWTEVFDGSTENLNICYQLNKDYEQENEDCLHLNVFTPQDPSASGSSLPVMVNIHGGGFISGSGLESSVSIGSMSPKYFMEEDVIFVSFNYRLGVFGFLSTGDEVVPGNAGLRDQIMALQWIQRNIAAFGGDPNKVTILGQSAGAASVGYLILSPAASGLFSGAILESGSPLCPWAYQRNQTRISFKTGSFVDSQFDSSTDSVKLLEVLQNAPAKTIDDAALAFYKWDSTQPEIIQRIQIHQGFYFAPVIDTSVNNPVVADYQYESLVLGKFNKVPTLMGTCAEEGLMNVGPSLNYTLNKYDQNSAYMDPQDVNIDNEASWNEVGSKIKQEYSPTSTFLDKPLGAIKYFTEHDFVKALTKHAELQSNYTDVYFYEFAFSGDQRKHIRYPGSGNVTHVEESGYLYWGVNVDNFPQEYQLIHKRLVRFWTNFARYRNPTPTEDELFQNIIWPKVQPENFQHVKIGNFLQADLSLVQGKPKAERMAFWDNIYNTYGNRPYDSY